MKKFLIVLGCILGAVALIFLGFLIANKINEGIMNGYIDSFETVKFENQLVPEFDKDGVPYFVTDRDFKVMHLTDIHITGGILGAEKDKKALNAVAAMISAERPDLVIVTGDISFAVPWYGSINNKYAHSYFSRLMEKLGVYWTVAFGNHDSENYNFYSRESVAKMYEDKALSHCLFDAGPDELYGECNHIINVKNSKGLITKSFIMMDSNAYTDEDPLGLGWVYDNIHEDQIAWYKSNIEKYNAENKAAAEALPESERPTDIIPESMLFFHIPIKEFRTAYTEYKNKGEANTADVTYLGGNVGEKSPYVYSSEIEDNLFETILELGSTVAVFNGHDHYNNIVLDYKGVQFSYGYSIDYSAYSGIDGEGYQRGCTIITCPAEDGFSITHENYYQDKYPARYEKESGVDMTKQKQ